MQEKYEEALKYIENVKNKEELTPIDIQEAFYAGWEECEKRSFSQRDVEELLNKIGFSSEDIETILSKR